MGGADGGAGEQEGGQLMSIHLRTEVRVYCDGGVHQWLEFTVSGDAPKTEARSFIRRAGWVVKQDGRTLCPVHAKEARRG